MDLNEVNVFLKVVQTGSFTKAAKLLGMPNSTVSSKISSLEARLRVTLITRTTRKLSVTEAGRAFFERCARGLEEIKTAEEEISLGQAEPSGTLKITAPVELGSVVLPTAIAAFTKKYPKVTLEFVLSDRYVDMVAEGVDLAIRAGELQNSTLKAKKLGEVYFAPFASKAYLKAHGLPKSPKELENHLCLHFPSLGDLGWDLSSAKSRVRVPIVNRIVMNDLNGLKAMTAAGLGIALLPTFLCHQEVRSEKLVRILPEWKTNLRPVHFVFPGEKFTSLKVRSFIESAEALIRSSLHSFEV